MDGVQRRLTSGATPSLLIQFHLQSSSHIVSPHFLTDEGQSSHSFPWWTESTLTELSPSWARGRASAHWAHGGEMAVVNMLTRVPVSLFRGMISSSWWADFSGSEGPFTWVKRREVMKADASLKLNEWGRGTREGQRLSTGGVFRSTEADRCKLLNTTSQSNGLWISLSAVTPVCYRYCITIMVVVELKTLKVVLFPGLGQCNLNLEWQGRKRSW